MADEPAAEVKEPQTEPTAPQVEVKTTDMSNELQEFTIALIQEAFEKYDVESDVATHIKRQMDVSHGLIWHCIVGCSFGSYVTHLQGSFLHVSVPVGKLKSLTTDLNQQEAQNNFVLLFKTN